MSSSRLACSGLLSAEPCRQEDGDKEARSAFDFGAQIAARSNAKLHVTFRTTGGHRQRQRSRCHHYSRISLADRQPTGSRPMG